MKDVIGRFVFEANLCTTIVPYTGSAASVSEVAPAAVAGDELDELDALLLGAFFFTEERVKSQI